MNSANDQSQQLLLLKQMYQKYNKLIFSAVVVLLLVAGGVRYWQYNTSVKIVQASDIYQQMLVAYFQPDMNTFNAKGETLIKDFKGTVYYQSAALMLANHAIAEGNLDKAEEYLKLTVAQKRSNNLLYDIAKVRLAQLMRERGNIDGGLKLLADKPYDKEYLGLYEETKGDLYFAKGDKTQAKVAYKLALESLPEGAQAPLIEMKLVDLGRGDDNAS